MLEYLPLQMEVGVGVNWNQGLMRWKPHLDGAGRYHPLSHLHPFRFSLSLADKQVMVAVGFAMHCFTRSRLDSDEESSLYSDAREVRTFCFERYALSKALPGIVRSLPERHCQYARNDNYVTVDIKSAATGQTLRYGVFFNLKRWRDGNAEPGVLLTVQSAYCISTEKSAPGRGKIRFLRVVELILDGKKPRPPR